MPPQDLVELCITDPALRPIFERIVDGERLSREEGLTLARTPDLNGLGAMADFVRRRLHGNRTYYVRNQHINYTNVCNKHCLFCYFARSPKDGGPTPYLLAIDQVRDALLRYGDDSVREIHIVGGVHPRLPYDYYLDLISTVKATRPHACIKAFTAVELAQIAEVADKPLLEVLGELKAAGLEAVPGGGAEVLSERVHDELYPKKLTPSEWLAVSRHVAEAGLAQYSTMLYGHIETPEERVDHLVRLRELQDATGHFLAFTPLSFHPEGTYLEHLPGPTGEDDLRMIALARLMLDNIPHIKTFWVMNTVSVSQVALCYGADDFDGTIEEYQITFEEGRFGDRRQYLTREQMLQLIQEAGFVPTERDGLYREVAS